MQEAGSGTTDLDSELDQAALQPHHLLLREARTRDLEGNARADRDHEEESRVRDHNREIASPEQMCVVAKKKKKSESGRRRVGWSLRQGIH